MSNIEDIKFIEEMIKEYKTFGDLHNPDFEDTDRIYKALENMLKRIKELEEKNKLLLNGKVGVDLSYDDYIPVQKVNDKIERYEYMLAETIHGKIQKYTPGEILLKIDTLKELLEDK